MKPKVIVTRDIPDEVELKLKEYFQVSFNREDKVFSNDILRKAMESADGIVCTVTDSITDELLTLPKKKSENNCKYRRRRGSHRFTISQRE